MSEANVDRDEIAQFDRIAGRWWDADGEMAALHHINPARLAYIERQAGGLRGKRAVDVGCGGGLLSEGLSAAGAEVTGIDLAAEALRAARAHAEQSGRTIEYREIAAEALADERSMRCSQPMGRVVVPSANVLGAGGRCRCGERSLW